jgi:GLPGLI family protein
MTYVLKFNDSLASYREDRKLESNSINDYARVFSGYQGPYFFQLKQGLVYRQRGKYLISKSQTDFKWNLTNEKLVINGLTCYKATTELHLQGRRGKIIRPVVAWYTNEINLLVGPDGFFGLPGLIIQTEVQNVVTTLTKIKFTNDATPISLPTSKKIMTETEFAEVMKDLIENRENYYGDN